MTLRTSLENGDSVGLEGTILAVSEHPFNREEEPGYLQFGIYSYSTGCLFPVPLLVTGRRALTSYFISPTHFLCFIPEAVTHSSSQGPGYCGYLCHLD